MISKQNNSIIIIGAGIVGTTLAWYLSQHYKGKITLIDKQQAAEGVTQHSFAWLNVSYGRPDGYSKLRQQALTEWRNLDSLTQGKLNINWSGAISWHETDAATHEFIHSHQKTGFNIKALTKNELQLIEPQLLSLPEVAAFSADEGFVDPVHATQTLLTEAIARGVNYLPEYEVLALEHHNHKIHGVITNKGTFSADQIIITAGVGSIELAQSLRVSLPITASPSIIVHYNNPTEQSFINHIISTPEMELRPVSSSKILCAEDFISDRLEDSEVAIAQNALTTIKKSFIGTDALNLEKAYIGMRPMPKDEMPIVGNVDDFEGLYIISMHAAITLAPLICKLAKEEIIDGIKQAALSPYRLTRFASGN
ncbi:NAD(P)/FAD-dependent oxidoreductase [Providencia sp. Je.9.19]|uniref:NAD(P)/FAD-dependent oxidoreductase n=1 Tax=Providencia sp. Je.9.19 TaxID=3142844 RepID=UPI003DA8FDAC